MVNGCIVSLTNVWYNEHEVGMIYIHNGSVYTFSSFAYCIEYYLGGNINDIK